MTTSVAAAPDSAFSVPDLGEAGAADPELVRAGRQVVDRPAAVVAGGGAADRRGRGPLVEQLDRHPGDRPPLVSSTTVPPRVEPSAPLPASASRAAATWMARSRSAADCPTSGAQRDGDHRGEHRDREQQAEQRQRAAAEPGFCSRVPVASGSGGSTGGDAGCAGDRRAVVRDGGLPAGAHGRCRTAGPPVCRTSAAGRSPSDRRWPGRREPGSSTAGVELEPHDVLGVGADGAADDRGVAGVLQHSPRTCRSCPPTTVIGAQGRPAGPRWPAPPVRSRRSRWPAAE